MEDLSKNSVETGHKLLHKLQFREGRWTKEEHNIFINETLRIGIKNWKKVKTDFKP
jgi:hypothetical protein